MARTEKTCLFYLPFLIFLMLCLLGANEMDDYVRRRTDNWALSIRNGPPVPVAARSKAWVCGRSLAGIAGSNSARGHGCLSVVSVVCCQVEVSATGRSLVQRSPTDCGASECDSVGSKTRKPWPTRVFLRQEGKNRKPQKKCNWRDRNHKKTL
jgi:hypothetical protein